MSRSEASSARGWSGVSRSEASNCSTPSVRCALPPGAGAASSLSLTAGACGSARSRLCAPGRREAPPAASAPPLLGGLRFGTACGWHLPAGLPPIEGPLFGSLALRSVRALLRERSAGCRWGDPEMLLPGFARDTLRRHRAPRWGDATRAREPLRPLP